MKDRRSSTSSSDDEESETRCGIGPCKPSWMQSLANSKFYILIYSLMGFFQAMFFSYSIATITTIEKQFKFNSRTMGIVLSGNECSQILLSIVLTYFGGNGHRPRLVALGMAFSGLSSLMVVAPHFMYGKYTPVTVNATRNLDLCSADELDLNCDDRSIFDQNIGALIFIFMSQFLSGIGTTLVGIMGITYMDDNVKRKQSPMLLGLMASLRMIGPTIGYVLARFFLALYVNLTEPTTLKPTDPAWIGAWWLGYLVIGIVQLGTGWMVALFPRTLPSQTGRRARRRADKVERTLKEFPAALKRLLTNKTLVFNNLAAAFYALAIGGYITFLPKYLETQYQQSAAQAGFINGVIATGSMAVAFIVSGLFISRFRPRAWVMAVYDVVLNLLFAAGLIFFAFWGCNTKSIQGVTKLGDQYQIEIATECNLDCHCSPNRFVPVCSADGHNNYFSACHSGCRSMEKIDGKKIYSDCGCMNSWSNITDQLSTQEPPIDSVTSGYCPSNCYNMFLFYVIGTAVFKFFNATGRVNGIITGFRCVKPEDKAFAIGLSSTFLSLVAYIPGPIVYGAIIDQACILWRTDCGIKGNCLMYDPEKFRLYLHFTTAAFVLVSAFLNSFVCYFVRNLDLYSENDDASDTEDQRKTPERTGMISNDH